MPILSWGHAQFWDGRPSTGVPPPSTEISQGGYPLWQSSVITASLFGVIGAWWDGLRARLRWWWRFDCRIAKLDGERLAVVFRVLDLLESPLYPLAQEAVRGTATTLGFNHPEQWKSLGRALKDDAGRAQNTFRHLEACRRTRETARAAGSTIAHAHEQLLVELAYHDFALHPHREVLT